MKKSTQKDIGGGYIMIAILLGLYCIVVGNNLKGAFAFLLIIYPSVFIAIFNNSIFDETFKLLPKIISRLVVAILLILLIAYPSEPKHLHGDSILTDSLLMSEIVATTLISMIVVKPPSFLKGHGSFVNLYLSIVLAGAFTLKIMNLPHFDANIYYTPQVIKEKDTHTHRGHTYHILRFDALDRFDDLYIDEDEYFTTNIGDTVKFKAKEGALGYDFYAGYEIHKQLPSK